MTLFLVHIHICISITCVCFNIILLYVIAFSEKMLKNVCFGALIM